MAYQPCTINNGFGGFSKLNNPPTHSGTIGVTADSGAGCWVRLLKVATVTASGANNTITDPTLTGYIDGWALIQPGGTLSFGAERASDTAESDQVAQIDIYSEGAIIIVNQH